MPFLFYTDKKIIAFFFLVYWYVNHVLAGDFAKYVLHSFAMQGIVFVCDEVAESLFDAPNRCLAASFWHFAVISEKM